MGVCVPCPPVSKQGEELELHELDRRLDLLVSNQRTLIFQYFRLALANTFSAVGGSLPWAHTMPSVHSALNAALTAAVHYCVC